MFPRKSFQHHYEGAMEPFRIIGNVYFVGTYPASSHLIDTEATAPLVHLTGAKTTIGEQDAKRQRRISDRTFC